MYSSAIYDAVQAPGPQRGLVFRGTLEEAQWRKLDTLLDRAQARPFPAFRTLTSRRTGMPVERLQSTSRNARLWTRSLLSETVGVGGESLRL